MRKKAQVLLIVVADACLSRVLRRLPGTPQTQAWSGRGTGPAAGAWHVLPRGSVGITVYESGAEGQRGLLRQGAAADPRWARRLSRRQGGPSMPLKGLWGLDFKGTEAETGSFRTSSVWYQWRPEEGLGATCFVGQGGLPPLHRPVRTTPTSPEFREAWGPPRERPFLSSGAKEPSSWCAQRPWPMGGFRGQLRVLRMLKLQEYWTRVASTCGSWRLGGRARIWCFSFNSELGQSKEVVNMR